MDEAVHVGLVHHDGRGVPRPPLGDGVNDPEGLEEGKDHVHDEQEKSHGGEQGKGDRTEKAQAARPVDARRLDHRAGNVLEGGQEERHVVAQMGVTGGKDHQDQGHPFLEKPVELQGRNPGQEVAQDPVGGVEDEEPDDPGDGGRYAESPEDRRPVKGQPPDFLVDQDGQEEGHGKTGKGDPQGKEKGMIDAPVVFRRGQQVDEVVQAHEDHPVPEGGYGENRKAQGIKGRPEEKKHHHHELGGDQEVGKDGILKIAFLHPAPRRSKRKKEGALLPPLPRMRGRGKGEGEVIYTSKRIPSASGCLS